MKYFKVYVLVIWYGKTIVAIVYLWLFTFLPRKDIDLDRMIAKPMHGCGK
jgi:hypothetical protein